MFRKILLTLVTINTIFISGQYPQYVALNANASRHIKTIATSGGYLTEMFTNNIRTSVHSILELGSRDAIDALKLSEHYKCHVFAFECNPAGIEMCKKNIDDNPNVTLVPYAVWNKTDTISFFPMVETDGVFYNPGASSCFLVDKSGHHKTYIQTEIKVPAIRLDEWLQKQGIDSIDMLCMDVQGSAFQVLEGMGSYLKKVKYIILEIEHKTIYSGETLYTDVEKLLNLYGFQMYVGSINRFFGDYLFVCNDLVEEWDAKN